MSNLIRKAKLPDCKNMAALSIQVWLHTYALDGIKQELSDYIFDKFSEESYQILLASENFEVYVCISSNHLVGLLVLDLDSTYEDERNGFEVVTLYVQEHFHNQCIGRALLSHIERVHGARFWLSTWAYNEKAIAFYKRAGFKDIGSIDFVIGNKSHENRVLAH